MGVLISRLCRQLGSSDAAISPASLVDPFSAVKFSIGCGTNFTSHLFVYRLEIQLSFCLGLLGLGAVDRYSKFKSDFAPVLDGRVGPELEDSVDFRCGRDWCCRPLAVQPAQQPHAGFQRNRAFQFLCSAGSPTDPPAFPRRAAQCGSGLMYRLSSGGLEGEAGSELVFQWAYIRV